MKPHEIANKEELIKALRCGGHNMIFHYCDKEDCPYCQYSYHDNLHRCNVRELGADAADALEAAENRIAELEAQMPWVESVMEDKLRQKIDELEAQIHELESVKCHCNVKENAELIARILDDDVDGNVYEMPKEGEWIMDENPHDGDCRCSVCLIAIDAMHERNHGLLNALTGGKWWTFYHYCPNCGARMDAESEADAYYQLSVLMQEYFERYEPTYNSEDGSM